MSRKYNKIGILTQYYKSHNYGGLLQAYALIQALESLGYRAEQISYDLSGENNQRLLESVDLAQSVSKNRIIKKIIHLFLDTLISRKLSLRYTAMETFGQSIPHSARVYTNSTIGLSQNDYEGLIVGSDQVWNPNFYFPTFFCDFVTDARINCIAYAASVSQSCLTKKQAEVYRNNLKNFSAISLREKNTEIIQNLTEKKVHWVLDPTLLLQKEKWDEVCSPRCIQEPYIFCYFLGRDSVERNLAKRFAREKGLKLVTIPHLAGRYEVRDWGFGDVKMVAASPAEFISLIKHADFVFTDSFHASVFSHIYQREFFVFHRVGAKGMATRIYSLLELYGTEERFCDCAKRQTLEYIFSLSDIDYSAESEKLVAMRDNSYNYLQYSLEDGD